MSTDDLLEDVLGESEQRRISDAVQAIIGQRALIEQTKGMLMFIYGIDADAAFEVLRRQSQHHNVKLRLIAAQIAKDLVELSQTTLDDRLAVDATLLTAQQRIADVAARPRDGQSTTDA